MSSALTWCWGTMALTMVQSPEQPSAIDQMEGPTMRRLLFLTVVPSLLCDCLMFWMSRGCRDSVVSLNSLRSRGYEQWYGALIVARRNSEGMPCLPCDEDSTDIQAKETFEEQSSWSWDRLWKSKEETRGIQ